MTDKIIYRLDGKDIEVEQDRAKEFEAHNPSASVNLTANGKNYSIPIAMRDRFLNDNPQAQYYKATPQARAQDLTKKRSDYVADTQAVQSMPDTPPEQPAYSAPQDPDYGLAEIRDRVNKGMTQRYDELVSDFKASRQAAIDKSKTGFGKWLRSQTLRDAQSYNPQTGQMQSNINELSDDKYRQLYSSDKLLSEAERVMQAAKDDRDGTFVGGALRGLRDGVFNVDTWLGGMSDMIKAGELYRLVEKSERGEELSETESDLLDAAAINAAVNAYYADQLGRGYKAGLATAESIPFMLEMIANPASSIGRTVAGRAARQALRKTGKKAAAKATGAAVGALADIAGAGTMAVTTGALRSGASALERATGKVQPATDEEGRAVYGGVVNRVPMGEAIAKGIASTAIENHSEMVGEYFTPIKNLIGKGISATGVTKLKPVASVLEFVKNVKASNLARNVSDFAREARWSGVPGEFAEEIVGGIEDALLVGDQTLDANPESGVFNPSNMYDTFLAVAMMGGIMGSVQLAGYKSPSKRVQAKYDAADKYGSAAISDWERRKTEMDNTESPEALTSLLWQYHADKSINASQKRALYDYAAALTEMRSLASQTNNVADESQSEDSTVLSRLATAISDAERAVMETDDNTAIEQGVIDGSRSAMQQSRSQLDAEELRIADSALESGNNEEIVSYLESHPDREKAVTDYMTSYVTALNQEYHNRMMQARSDAQMQQEMYTKLSNEDSGDIVEVEMKDGTRAYVIGGSVIADSENNIDRNASDDTFVVADETGKRRQVGLQDLSKVTQVQKADVLQSMMSVNEEEIMSQIRSDLNAPTEAEMRAGIRYGEPAYISTPTGVIEVEPRAVDSEGNVILATKDGVTKMPLAEFVKASTQAPQTEQEQAGQEQVPAQATAATDAQQTPVEQQTPVQAGQSEVTQPEQQEAPQTDTAAETQTELDADAEQALFGNDPEAWAEYNDRRNNDNGEDSKAFLSSSLDDVQKERQKLQEKYSKAKTIADRRAIAGDIARLSMREQAITRAIAKYGAAEQEAQTAEQPTAQQPSTPHPTVTLAGQAKQQQAQEAIQQAEKGFPSIQQKWQSAQKVEGWEDQVTLANGEQISGRYYLVEADAPTASHNPEAGFAMTEGFPVDEHGRTVNDRDYQNDRQAQDLVAQRASDYDSRALQTPVVVTGDGVVLSGNDRTMSSQIAAKNGTDSKYVDYLRRNARRFGFTSEQVAQFSHPRVVFVPDAQMPYDAATFAKFNQSDTKTQNRTEQAVKAGKTISDETFAKIAATIDGYETLAELYRDANAVSELIRMLVDSGVITREQVPSMLDGEQLSGAGIDIIESLLVGKVLEEDALRAAMADKSIRKAIVSAIAPIVANRVLEGYNLTSELSDAINLLYKAKKAGTVKTGEDIRNHMVQLDMFGDNPVAEATVQILANAINDTKSTMLRKVISSYNQEGELAAAGQMDMFTGDVRAKEDILRDILKQYGYDTTGIKTVSAEDYEEQSGQQDAAGEADNAPQGDAEGEAAVSDGRKDKIAEEEDKVDQNPTDAQKEAGNYRKGHITLDGRQVTIENPKGSVRSGVDADGNAWSTEMKHTYGYFRGTEGKDGDHIDVFIGDNLDSDKIFVVDQVNPDGSFDEHKVMYGFNSAEEAREAYLSNYEEGWQGLGAITEVSKEDFYKWLDSSKRKGKPFAEYSSVKSMQAAKEKEVSDAVSRWSNDLGIEIVVHADTSTITDDKAREAIESGRNVTGWYNVSTGQINVYLPNVKDASEIEAIVRHEIIAHKGLRGLLGKEGFDAFCDRVWDSMSKEDRKKFIDYIAGRELSLEEYARVMSNQEYRRAAADEYVAFLSENMEDNRSAFDKIADIVRDFLRSIGFRLAITEAEIRDALLLSEDRLRRSRQMKDEIENERELTEEEIRNLDIDEVLKTGAIAYVNGNRSPAVETIYQIVKQYVRDQSQLRPGDSANADTALVGSRNDEASGGTGGQEGGDGVGLDREDGQTDVSADGQGGEARPDDMAQPDGEGGDSGMASEESGSGDVPSGRAKRGRSGGVRGKRGDVRKPGGQGGGTEVSEDDGGRRSDSDEIAALLEDITNDLKDFFKFPTDRLYDVTTIIAGLGKNALSIFAKTAKLGYILAKTGFRSFNGWVTEMHNKLDAILKEHSKLDDALIDEFIRNMWEYPISMNGEVHSIREWASVLEQEELRRIVRMTIEEKRELQKQAEGVETVVGDIDNIRKSLPFLLPAQQEDVQKAEVQFFSDSHKDELHANGKGYMFTNGTGTGKTYTGLGIVKRFIKQGKGRVLIVTAQEKKINDWINDAKNLGIEATMLENTTSKGSGVVVTQYANIRQNLELLKDEFDLIVYDESHKLMENQTGEATTTSEFHHMLANRDVEQAILRELQNTELWKRDRLLQEKQKEIKSLISQAESHVDAEVEKKIKEYGGIEKLRQEAERVEAELKEISKLKEAELDKAMKDPERKEKAQKAVERTKVVFLSATPFNTAFSLDYAEGYIFTYPKVEGRKMSREQLRDSFVMERFPSSHSRDAKGSVRRKSEGAITDPNEASKEEIAFSDYLQDTLNTMSGRSLDSAWDYSREFPLVDIPVVDQFNSAVQELTNGPYAPLKIYFSHLLNNYPEMTALFEAIKTAGTLQRIRDHIELGRKVVVFHRRVSSETPLEAPFARGIQNIMATGDDVAKKAAVSFMMKYKDLFDWEKTLDFSFPHEQITKAFATKEDFDRFNKEQSEWIKKSAEAVKAGKKVPPQPKLRASSVGLFNGTEKQSYREKVVNDFNDDNSGLNVLVVQVQSGKEGISLHDTTGTHQRAEISLHLPQSPIEFIQSEGRIYRVGNKSNAIFEYPLLGIDIELSSFAMKINGRSQTAENLALGSRARGLRDSIARAALASRNIPVSKDQGVGGKKLDDRSLQEATGYDTAIENYAQWADSEKDVKYNDASIPDPIGYKMNEWGKSESGEVVLVPDAGTGTVARYSPQNAKLIALEPDMKKYSKLVTLIGGGGRRIESQNFEDFSERNKSDVLIIKTSDGYSQSDMARRPASVNQIIKAMRHTEDGGRIVAMVQEKHAAKVKEIAKASNMFAVSAEVILPESAMNGEKTRILIIDRVENDELRKAMPESRVIDLSNIADKKDLFEKLRTVDVPERTIDKVAKVRKRVEREVKKLEDNPIIPKSRYQKSGKDIYYGRNEINITFKDYTLWLHLPGKNSNAWYRQFLLSYNRIADNDLEYIEETARTWVDLDNVANMSLEEMYSRMYTNEKNYEAVKEMANGLKKVIQAALNKSENQIKNIAKGEMENKVSGTYTFEQFKDIFYGLNKGNAAMEALAEKVFNAASKVEGLGFEVADSRFIGDRRAIAVYVPSRNKIYINSDLFNSYRLNDEIKSATLVHELIHSVTSYMIDKYENGDTSGFTEAQKQACKDILEVYDAINNNEFRSGLRINSKIKDNAEYGLTNPKEMMAELSNPVFRAALKAKKLWRQLINGIKKLLGIDVTGEAGTETDALTTLENALDVLMDNYDPYLYQSYTGMSDRLGDDNVRFREVKHIGSLPEGKEKVSFVERTYRKNGYFSFTGKDEIKTVKDVAFIFKQLEDYAVENSFIVLVNKGKPFVLHVGMGNMSSSIVDFTAAKLAYDKFGADEIYMVHNHPSGQLVASQSDIRSLSVLKNMFPNNIVKDGIIINTISGKFLTFNSYDSDVNDMPKRQQKTGDIEVHTFDKNVFNKDYDPSGLQVRSTEDVAKIISSQRFGTRGKVSVLVMNNANRIVGNVHTTYSDTKNINLADFANEIVSDALSMGGRAVIVYGSGVKLNRSEFAVLESEIKRLSGENLSLLDSITTLGNVVVDSVRENEIQYQNDIRFRSSETEYVEGVADRLNAGVRFSDSDSEGKRNVKSFLDSNGDVVMLYDRIGEGDDMILTFLNQYAKRNGFSKVLAADNGRYSDFIKEMFSAMDVDSRRAVIEKWREEGMNPNSIADAVSEYVTYNRNASVPARVSMTNILRRNGIDLENVIDENQLAYIMGIEKIDRDNRSRIEKAALSNALEYSLRLNRPSDIRFRQSQMSSKENEEIENIISSAKANGTYLKAPNGADTNLTPSQWAAVRTKAFKDWFGDWENDPANASKVMDKNGEPMVVYHGTRLMELYFKDGLPYTSRIDRFNEFKEGKGFFTPDKNAAISFADGNLNGLYKVFLNARNPYKYDAEGRDWDNIKPDESYVSTDDIVSGVDKKLHDAVHIINVANENNGRVGNNIDEYVVFTPSQIKLATDNVGTFSNETDDIRFRAADDNEAIKAVKEAVGMPVSSWGYWNSQYMEGTTEDGEKWVIRVSDHPANMTNFRDKNPDADYILSIVVDSEFGDRSKRHEPISNDDNVSQIVINAENLDIDNLRNGIETFKRNGRSEYVFSDIDTDILYRIEDTVEQSGYEERMKSLGFKLKEQYVDYLESLKILQDEATKYGEQLNEYEDAYTAEIHRSSRNRAETDKYMRNFFSPLIGAVRDLMNGAGISYDDVIKYVMSKHGLERNKVFARRDADRAFNDKMQKLNSAIAEMKEEAERKLKDKKISQEEFDSEIKKIDSHYEERKKKLDKDREKDYEKNRKRDYSGLTSLHEVEDTEGAEEAAQSFVEMVESGNKELADALWYRINRATKESLNKSYQGGLISRQNYENIRDMFQYYVPLRGFDETTAEDVYEYVGKPDVRINPAVKSAKGRSSMADDPFVSIGSMAESSIVQANKNLVKMRLLNLAQNRYQPDEDARPLLSYTKVWYVNVGTPEEPKFVRSVPDFSNAKTQKEIEEAMAEHEEHMKELASQDMAFSKAGKLNIPFRSVSTREDLEHIVFVRVGGNEYAVFINGDPRAAQALNGLLSPDTSEIRKRIRSINRWLAANYTTRSPKFILRNLIRDTIYSLYATSIREDKAYLRKFASNISANYARMWGLVRKYGKGQLDTNIAIERYMQEFIDNGGETGYTAMTKADDFRKMIQKYIKSTKSGEAVDVTGTNALLDFIDFANRCAEDMSRFACYVTSRQSGRSIERSIDDAKNITVNFNRKGAQDKYGSGLVSSIYLFFNAGVQGMYNFSRLAKKNPKKFAAHTSVWLGLGALVPFLNSVISAAVGGDDDEYYDMPDWMRRNSIMIGGNGFYVTLPLPIEIRAMYGIGDIAYSWATGRMKHKNVGLELLEQISSMSPIDPVSGEGLLGSLVPDILSPIYQAYAVNRDFTGRPIYKDYTYNKLYPEWTKAYAGTNNALVKSAEVLNSITGGDIAKRGAVNLNPARAEHIFQGYLGGLATFFNEIYKTGSMIWDPDARQLRNIPVANVLLQANDERTQSSYINDLYYYYKEESSETQIMEREYKSNIDYIAKYSELAGSDRYMRSKIFRLYEKRIKELQDMMYGNDTIDKTDIQRQIEELKREAVQMLIETEN